MSSTPSRTFQVVGSITVVLLTFGVLGAVAYLKYMSVKQAMAAPPPPESPVAVTFVNAQPTSFRRSTTTIGTVRAPQSIQLRTELTGVITNIPMVSGSIVNAGDLLVQLDDSIEQAQLKGAMAAKRIAESTLRRNREAARLQAITELEVEQAEASLAQAQAEIERLQAVIAKKTLKAPFKARVGLFDWHLGQYLPEGAVVTTLQGVESFAHVDFSVPQHVADAIQLEQTVKLLTLQGPLDAIIIAMDSQADRITRSVMIRAKLENPPQTLQPNDSVKVAVEYGDPLNAIAVPATAIRRTPTGSMVYMAVPDKSNALRAVSRQVAVYSSVGDVAIVGEGLKAGELIVANGSFKVRDTALLADASASSPVQVPSEKQVSSRPAEGSDSQ